MPKDGLPILHAQGPMTRRITKIIHEGRFAAEIPIDLIEDDTGWSPYVSLDDALKLDEVREALRAGDITRASQFGRVFELLPLTA